MIHFNHILDVRLSCVKGRLMSNVVLCQRFYSVKCCLPSKFTFCQGLSQVMLDRLCQLGQVMLVYVRLGQLDQVSQVRLVRLGQLGQLGWLGYFSKVSQVRLVCLCKVSQVRFVWLRQICKVSQVRFVRLGQLSPRNYSPQF